MPSCVDRVLATVAGQYQYHRSHASASAALSASQVLSPSCLIFDSNIRCSSRKLCVGSIGSVCSVRVPSSGMASLQARMPSFKILPKVESGTDGLTWSVFAIRSRHFPPAPTLGGRDFSSAPHNSGRKLTVAFESSSIRSRTSSAFCAREAKARRVSLLSSVPCVIYNRRVELNLALIPLYRRDASSSCPDHPTLTTSISKEGRRQQPTTKGELRCL